MLLCHQCFAVNFLRIEAQNRHTCVICTTVKCIDSSRVPKWDLDAVNVLVGRFNILTALSFFKPVLRLRMAESTIG